ncbi:N-alpha-acetyltransferase 35, NatC auxiliary subunit [Golovinomyces cichoracearum]|uniref:N-alpha-acetyltransferase 35, NatC auxiliary subunit n=1 Tax=Golovinomyces cichoracearum TaxID=62708 RepID=A0A420HG25_9PEZI|nr:N-alpha-acetyltransferase 35, NatC auxiliary subunit [Golovinomyces cichoracearum]
MSSDALDAVSNKLDRFDVNESRQGPPTFGRNETTQQARLKSNGVLATDITDHFITAVQQLDAGHIVRDHNFTLFESIGALEIMDRKMDSGYLEPGETIQDDFDFLRDLLAEEVIGIIDQLQCHEMAWHMGHPLAQTIFTSLHIDRLLSPCPTSLEDTRFDRGVDDEPTMNQVLRAYCLGLDEDFVTHTHSISLLENVEITSVLEFLEETIYLVKSSNYDENHKSALIIRLRLRIEFLRAVENAESINIALESKHWINLKSMISELKISAMYGTSVPSAFSEKLQRKLASTVPPRPTVQVLHEDALNHFERLCLDASAVVEILNYFDYVYHAFPISKAATIGFIEENLAKTVLPTHLILDKSNDEIEVPSDYRYKIAAQMENFRSRAAGSYLDMLRAFCQNRCRIRRALCHTILDWENLQLDTEEIDRNLQSLTSEDPRTDTMVSADPIWPYPLSSWAYYYKICQMEWIVQLGFELETYQPIEFASMYWYLHYLASNRSHLIERINCFIVHSYNAAQKEGKITPHSHHEFSDALQFINVTKISLAATRSLASGLSSLLTALKRLSLIQSAPQPYSNDGMRFVQLVSQPEKSVDELLNFAMKSIADAKKSFEALTKLTPKESFCRGSNESWIKDVKKSLKACILASVTVFTVAEAFKASKISTQLNLKVEIPKPESSYHYWWIVPTVIPISLEK